MHESSLSKHEPGQSVATESVQSGQNDLPQSSDLRIVKTEDIHWVERPLIQLSPELIDKYTNHGSKTATIEFDADINGNVKKAIVVQSLGDSTIDKVFRDAVLAAKLSLYQQNGVYVPFKAVQKFTFDIPETLIKLSSPWRYILMLLVFWAFIPSMKK